MRHGKTVIVIFTAFLAVLLAGVLFLTAEEQNTGEVPEVRLSFRCRSGSGEEQIRCWKDPEEGYYVFLPSYARMEDVFAVSDGDRASIGDVQLTDGTSCRSFALETAYPFRVEADGKTLESTITFVRSGNLPTLYIDVRSGSMEYIHMEKGNEENGRLRLYDAQGQLSYSGGLTIEGRGNSSWAADKKPYNLLLDQEADLLGMGMADSWALLAEGYNPAVIRNKIVYDFAEAIGMEYTPQCQWVDLYLNGEYVGLYELSEKNEVHRERVNISQESGSFLVSMEYESRLAEQKYPYLVTDAGQALRIRYASGQLGEIRQKWQSAENAILAEDGIDPVSGTHWRELIDLDSWARKYLIEEVFANLDAGSLSQFYYCDAADPSGKIYAGPVWDYDFSMGGEDVWLKPYTDYFAMNRASVNDEIYTPWFASLYRQEEFLNRVKEMYETEFLPELEHLADVKVTEYQSAIEAASEMNRIRCFREYVGQRELQEEFEYIKVFLKERIAFLTDLWIYGTEYHTVCVSASINGNFAVKDGELLPEGIRNEEPGGYGWYDLETDEPFDIQQPICEDVKIYVKRPENTLPVIHYLPAVALVVLLPVLLMGNGIRNRQNRRPKNESAKIH